MEVRSVTAGGARWKSVPRENIENKGALSPLVRQDISDFSGKKVEDWDTFLKEWMATAGIQADGVRITVMDGGKPALLRYANTAGSGTHLLVGRDFLRAMEKDTASYQKGSEILGQVISLLQGSEKGATVGAQISATELTFWDVDTTKGDVPLQDWEREVGSANRLLELMKKARNEMDQLQKKFRIPANSNLYQARAEAMGRLSRATTTAGVSSAVSMARRSIGTLKMALRTGEESEKKKIRAAIAGLESVAVRGARKNRALREEQMISQRQERAKESNQRRREAQLKHELQQRQTVRKVRERSQIMEGLLPIAQQEYARKLQVYETSVATEAISVVMPAVESVVEVAQTAPVITPMVSVAPAIVIRI